MNEPARSISVCRTIIALSMLILLVGLSGCTKRGPLFPGAQYGANNANGAGLPQSGALAQANTDAANFQLRDLNDRLSQFDADNRDLQTQIARLQQQLSSANEEKRLIRQQLADAAKQLQESQIARKEIDQRLNVMHASTTGRTGNSFQVNSSWAESLRGLKALGVEVWQEGDVVRVELPTDRLFVQGTYQLQSNGASLLDQVATEIKRNMPRQIVGIEAHTDNSPLADTVTTHHQITATQALTVFNHLQRSQILPPQQMFTMGMGANRPRFSNGDAAGRSRNRRIELVIYPEPYEG
jgi:flagellar motor protein MotB